LRLSSLANPGGNKSRNLRAINVDYKQAKCLETGPKTATFMGITFQKDIPVLALLEGDPRRRQGRRYQWKGCCVFMFKAEGGIFLPRVPEGVGPFELAFG